MDVYGYIADANPYVAKGLCHKYGYETTGVRSKSDLGVCLKQLVATQGQNAFIDMMENHPDKDVILELFANNAKPEVQYMNADGQGNNSGQSRGCGGCKGCGGNNDRQYSNADGSAAGNSNVTITSAAIIAGALLLAVAIISKSH